MPNAEGRELTRGEKAAATRKANAEKAAANATPEAATPTPEPAPAAESSTPRRKSPLERAEESLAKATAELQKIKDKRAKLKEAYDELAQEERDAQDEVDYAAIHPALVRKARAEQGEGGAQLADDVEALTAVANQPAVSVPPMTTSPAALPAYPDPSTFPPASGSESEEPQFADGSEIISTVPLGEGDEDDDVDTDEDVSEDEPQSDEEAQGGGPAEAFEYEQPEPIVTQQPAFDFAAALAQSQTQSDGPQTFRV